MGLFKNPATFGKYVSPLTGSDGNDGTISLPYATLTKSGATTILLCGKTNENIVMNGFSVTGDNELAEINGSITGVYGQQTATFINLKISSIDQLSGTIFNCRISTIYLRTYGSYAVFCNNFIINFYPYQLSSDHLKSTNNTIFNFINYLNPQNFGDVSKC